MPLLQHKFNRKFTLPRGAHGECAVDWADPEGDFLGGGGTTFDCHAPHPNVETLPAATGTGMGDGILGDSPYGAINGDSFDGYAEQDPITETLDQGVGIAAWIHGDGPE